LHLGRASQLGLESALLAQQGLRGPATVLEGRYGYFNAFSMPPNMQRLLAGLGQTWLIQPPSLKSYATHVTHQAVVQAIQDFKRHHTLHPQRISRIAVRGTPHIMDERHAVREPETVMGGQYSLPFTTAVALTRDLSNPLEYNEATIHDRLVRDLARRVELLPVEDLAHPAPGLYPADVLLDYDGQSYTLPTAPHKGSPHNPCTWDDVCEKFCRFTASIISTTQAQDVIDVVSRLERVTDMHEVTRLITASL
jgi:2-methylcitrate dehydratase PrpD